MTKFASLIFLIFGLSVSGQRLADMTNYPVPPQTSNLFKAIAAPVSYYTGQPDISIPLFTINQDGVEVPIKIAFNTSGIAVEEEASCVGLGVSMSWGGSIARSANGAQDETNFFWDSYIISGLSQDIPKDYQAGACYPYCNSPASQAEYMNRQHLYYEANKFSNPYELGPLPANSDLRPDDFYYNFLDKAGKFKFNQQDRKFVTFPLDDIKIQNLATGISYPKFDITRSDGTKVSFGGDDAIESTMRTVTARLVSSFFVKRILTPKKTSIDYSYIANFYEKVNRDPFEFRYPAPPVNYNQGGTIHLDILKEALVKTINFKQGRLEFEYVSDRQDRQNNSNLDPVYANLPGSRLNRIILYNTSNQVVKAVQFHQSYFNANSVQANHYDKRLRLDSLSILDNGFTKIERYKFQYHTVAQLPAKNSMAKDHWGYYNGATTNTSWLPSTVMPVAEFGVQSGTSWSGYDNLHDYYMQGLKGNKFVNSTTNKVFTIKKIIFPTGGEREFVFEDNQVAYSEMATYMKDMSNDSYDFVNIRTNVQGLTLSTVSTQTPIINTATERLVYTDQFTVQGFQSTVANEPNIYIRSNFVRPDVSTSQLNSYQYRITIALQRKNDTGNNWTTVDAVTFDRYDSNFSTDPLYRYKKTASLSGGIYRFEVRMTTPPAYLMGSWMNSGHFTVIGLTYRKFNFENIRVGGLRIKEIIDRSESNEYKTTYDYNLEGGYSSGHMVNLPDYFENIQYSIPTDIQQIDGSYKYKYIGKRVCENSVLPLTKTQGSNVGYTEVTVRQIGASNSIKDKFSYSFIQSPYSGNWRLYYYQSDPKDWQRGKLLSHKRFKDNLASPIWEENYQYYGQTSETDKGSVEEINTNLLGGWDFQYYSADADLEMHIDRRPTNPQIYAGASAWPSLYNFDVRSTVMMSFSPFMVFSVSPPAIIPYFKHYTGFDKLKTKTTTNYLNGGSVVQTENYYYDNLPAYPVISRQETLNSSSEILATKYYYAQDLSGEPYMPNLVSEYKVGNPIKTEQSVNGAKISEEKFSYVSDSSTSNLLLANGQYQGKFPNNLPTIPNMGQIEKKVSFDLYDDNGNLLQFTPIGGVSTVIIWGYKKSLPIAKLENASWSQVQSYVTNLQTLSDTGTENDLITALNNLRTVSGLQAASITTYTHKILVGVSTITDAKGDKISYTYDAAGRLQFVKDKDNNILSENSYHYK